MHRLLRYFEYKHLPANLQQASRPFYELAHAISGGESLEGSVCKDEAERTVALRKLLEAKDAYVRSCL